MKKPWPPRKWDWIEKEATFRTCLMDYISWQRRRWPPNWGLAEARPNYVHVDLQSTSHCRTFSIGTHTTVKVRLQEIVDSDRSLRKYQTSIDGPIPFTSEAHFLSHDVLWQGQTKAFSVQWRKVPPCFGRWWRCCQSITHWAFIALSLATLFWCSLPFLKQQSITFFEIGIQNWQSSSLPLVV